VKKHTNQPLQRQNATEHHHNLPKHHHDCASPSWTAHVSLVGFLKNDNVWQSPRWLCKCTCAGSSKPWDWHYPALTPCRSHPVGSLHHQFRLNWWQSCGIHKGSVCKSPRLDQAQQNTFLSQLHQQYRQEITSFLINFKCIDAW
jgi:hypothetical protein